MELNDTITKLSESLTQYSATALNNLTLPEYDGSPGQDIKKFLKKFKIATLTLNDELKCLALDKSLIGSAHVWAKANIKQHIRNGEWSESKRKLAERFMPPDSEIRQLERLQKLRYKPEEITLSSYVEVYADAYKKCHAVCTDSDIIKSLRLNLSNDILRHLNMVADAWTELTSLKEFMPIVRRLECKILPYEQKQKAEENNNLVALTKALRELKDSVTSQAKPAAENQEVVAALNTHQQQTRASVEQRPANIRKAYPERYEPRQRKQFRQTGNYSRDLSQPTKEQRHAEAKRKYEEKHGKPPGPCYGCGGDHFNKHCPFALN